jgi:hypothetical protein
MATTTTMGPYRTHDSSVALYQVPEFVVGGEKMLFHALYGNEAYEKLRKFLFNISLSCFLFRFLFFCFIKKILFEFYLFFFNIDDYLYNSSYMNKKHVFFSKLIPPIFFLLFNLQ